MNAKGILAVALVGLLAILVLISVAYPDPITPVPDDAGVVLESESGIRYEVIEIEGMPCIWVYGNTRDYQISSEYAGLDCDWSQHPSHRGE